MPKYSPTYSLRPKLGMKFKFENALKNLVSVKQGYFRLTITSKGGLESSTSPLSESNTVIKTWKECHGGYKLLENSMLLKSYSLNRYDSLSIPSVI